MDGGRCVHKVLEIPAQVVVTKRGQSNHDSQVFAKQREGSGGRARAVVGQIKAAFGVVVVGGGVAATPGEKAYNLQ